MKILKSILALTLISMISFQNNLSAQQLPDNITIAKFYLENKKSDKVLESDGQKVFQTDKNATSDAQQWVFEPVNGEDKFYKIKNVKHNKYLDITASSTNANTPIILWGGHNGDNQKWTFIWAAGKNTFKIKSKLKKGAINLVMGIKDNSKEDGAETVTKALQGAESQKFKLVEVKQTKTVSVTFKNSVKRFKPNYVVTSDNGLNETVKGKLGPVTASKDNSFTKSFTINEGQSLQVEIKTSDVIQSNVKTIKTVTLDKNSKITTSGKKKDIQVTIE